MTSQQLINALQNWQEIHGVRDIVFQQSLDSDVETNVRGCVVAEYEDGSMKIVLFNNMGDGNEVG